MNWIGLNLLDKVVKYTQLSKIKTEKLNIRISIVVLDVIHNFTTNFGDRLPWQIQILPTSQYTYIYTSF